MSSFQSWISVHSSAFLLASYQSLCLCPFASSRGVFCSFRRTLNLNWHSTVETLMEGCWLALPTRRVLAFFADASCVGALCRRPVCWHSLPTRLSFMPLLAAKVLACHCLHCWLPKVVCCLYIPLIPLLNSAFWKRFRPHLVSSPSFYLIFWQQVRGSTALTPTSFSGGKSGSKSISAPSSVSSSARPVKIYLKRHLGTDVPGPRHIFGVQKLIPHTSHAPRRHATEGIPRGVQCRLRSCSRRKWSVGRGGGGAGRRRGRYTQSGTYG